MEPKRWKWAFPIGAAILSAVGGFLFGYDTGVVSGAMIQLRRHFSLSYVYQELIVSITLGSAAVAAFSCGFFADWMGRKPVIVLASAIFAVGAVILGASYSRGILLVGRLIVGVGIGMASMMVPVYIAEVSPSNLRGALVTLGSVSITVGQMIAAIVDGLFMSDAQNGWRFMLGLGGIPSLIQFFGFLAMPETPRWLVEQGRLADAKTVLVLIHGEKVATPEVEQELDDIINAARHHTQHLPTLDVPEPSNYGRYPSIESELPTTSAHSQKDDVPLVRTEGSSFFGRLTLVRMLRYPPTRRALVVGCSLQLFQQLVGINTVMYYSASIISMAGIGSNSDTSDRDATVVWMSAMAATVNSVFCMTSPCLISRFRRRTLLIWSLSGVLISLLLLGTSFQLMASKSDPVTLIEPAPTASSADHCYSALTCDSCMRTAMCGFCYRLGDDHSVVNGSCLPAPERFAEHSVYGRCANETDHNAIWAFDHCPSSYGWMTIFGLVLYLASFASGMASLPWTINSELYPTWARSTGVACSTGTNWISNIIVSLTFLSLTQAVTRQGTYFIYAGITVLAITFVYKFVPETGQGTLEDIDQTVSRVTITD